LSSFLPPRSLIHARQRHHNPEGNRDHGYVNGDIPLDPARFRNVQADKPVIDATVAQGSAAPATSADSALSSVDVKSSPDGAEITIDEKYMGSTPSTLKLPAGDHKVKLEKSGFKVWERTLAIGAGATANVNATLDKE